MRVNEFLRRTSATIVIQSIVRGNIARTQYVRLNHFFLHIFVLATEYDILLKNVNKHVLVFDGNVDVFELL